MAIITTSRKASADEIVAEMDRRGSVIEKLEAELLKVRPFSKYPEDRETMLNLSRAILNGGIDSETLETKAVNLADMVKAILEDEAFMMLAGA